MRNIMRIAFDPIRHNRYLPASIELPIGHLWHEVTWEKQGDHIAIKIENTIIDDIDEIHKYFGFLLPIINKKD